MKVSVPQDLSFDDEPLDGILYGEGSSAPTPADIMERWRAEPELATEEFAAVLAILLRDPGKGPGLGAAQQALLGGYLEQPPVPDPTEPPDQCLKRARLCHAVGRLDQAEMLYRRVLDESAGTGRLPEEDRRQAREGLARLLEQAGRTAEARMIKARAEGERLLASRRVDDLIEVRTLACDLYQEGNYREAERLYRGMLKRRFQEPGTQVHLARVLLMQDRLPEARGAVAAAAAHLRKPKARQVNPTYVLHRVLFLRILLAMLAGRSLWRKVAILKAALRETPERVLWTIAPVIDHFRSHLRQEDLGFLEVVGAAISSGEKLDGLNVFEAWTTGEGPAGKNGGPSLSSGASPSPT